MHAVITVVGSDKVGILAKVSTICAEQGVNVEEVTQSILRGTFAMIMLVRIPEEEKSFGELSAQLKECGKGMGVEINMTRQEIFDSMHRI